MISLEQVRALEARVEKAVSFIATLRAENASLKDGLLEAELRTEAAEARTAELEGLIKEFQKDQERIEEGIVQALRKLDAFEDVVHAVAKPAGTTAPEPVPAPMPVQTPGKTPGPLPVAPETRSGMKPAVHVDTEPLAMADSVDESEAEGVEDPGSDQSDGLDIF
jgi:FtsZ-binding cell division protein ZapB